MAVMLNMADLVDGFPSPCMLSLRFIMYNQILELSLPAAILWHVSCDLPILAEHGHCRALCKI